MSKEIRKYIREIISESINEGKIKLNRYLYHASNVSNRKRINKNGIVPYRGVQWLDDTDIEGNAVFATNSDNQGDWFDSTWDDDVWRIDTKKLNGVKWFLDPNTDNGVWVYTHEAIPRDAIELFKKGTGKDLLENENEDKKIDPNFVYNYVNKLHNNGWEQTDFEDDVWITNDHDYFELKEISLDDPFVKWNKKPSIYSNLTTEFPPIVVSWDGWIIDGMHRSSSARERGDKKIMAYIGHKREKKINEISNQENELKIPQIPGTMNFWHGGNLDVYDDIIAQKNGRYEYGPGLYLTTQFEVAEKYSKGSRKMYLVTVANGVEIHNGVLPEEAVKQFIKSYILGSKKKEVWERIQKYKVDGGFKAFVFNNIVLNEKAIKPSNTSKLRQFYVDNGIDYEIVDNAFGWHETMMVLYNMKKIVQTQVLKPGQTPEKYNLHDK